MLKGLLKLGVAIAAPNVAIGWAIDSHQNSAQRAYHEASWACAATARAAAKADR